MGDDTRGGRPEIPGLERWMQKDQAFEVILFLTEIVLHHFHPPFGLSLLFPGTLSKTPPLSSSLSSGQSLFLLIISYINMCLHIYIYAYVYQSYLYYII